MTCLFERNSEKSIIVSHQKSARSACLSAGFYNMEKKTVFIQTIHGNAFQYARGEQLNQCATQSNYIVQCFGCKSQQKKKTSWNRSFFFGKNYNNFILLVRHFYLWKWNSIPITGVHRLLLEKIALLNTKVQFNNNSNNRWRRSSFFEKKVSIDFFLKNISPIERNVGRWAAVTKEKVQFSRIFVISRKLYFYVQFFLQQYY